MLHAIVKPVLSMQETEWEKAWKIFHKYVKRKREISAIKLV